ncbi:hypothetical protein ABT160_43095 [Streptomyces sp. NPDC001941]|uniref:hypothetical protein n=1 Tax=Streptomyces sp. NPDC001941 TaxID=3154659 RepID=UPI003321885C
MNKGLAQMVLTAVAEVASHTIGLSARMAPAHRADEHAPQEGTAPGTDNAAPATRTALFQARSNAVRLEGRGSNTTFGTWFFSNTELSVRNEGASPGEAMVQTLLGADPEWIPVSPGETMTIRRWWGAVPIRVVNTGSAPLTVWTL